MQRTSLVFGLVTLLVGCASSKTSVEVASPKHAAGPAEARTRVADTNNPVDNPPPKKLVENSTAAPSDAPAELVAALPTSCETPTNCVPPKEFVAAACKGRYPSMALAMFEKRTPWQRLYVRTRSLDAINAYGERTTAAPLTFGEEVLVLRGASQPKAGKFQVSSSDIDVLRWDGSCATVDRGNFSTTRMAELVLAPIRWRHLEDAYQDALLGSKYVAVAYEKHRAVCKAARDTAMTPDCQKATQRLTDAIGVTLRDGLSLPTPKHLPAWARPDQLKEPGAVAWVDRRRLKDGTATASSFNWYGKLAPK